MQYNTEQKAKIIDFLKSNRERAYSADEIYKAIAKTGEIGKSTVFRRLSQLSDEGVIRRITDGSSRHVTYRLNCGEECHSHLHLSCTSCGKLIHLDEETSHNLEMRLLSDQSFRIDPGAALAGICKDCTEYRKSK